LIKEFFFVASVGFKTPGKCLGRLLLDFSGSFSVEGGSPVGRKITQKFSAFKKDKTFFNSLYNSSL
jgi:hypothetical protein